MDNLKYYFMAFALMLAIYGVTFAGVWRQTKGVSETLKHRLEQIEEASEAVRQQ